MFSSDPKELFNDKSGFSKEKFAKDPRASKIFLADGIYHVDRSIQEEFHSVKKVLEEYLTPKSYQGGLSIENDSLFLTEVGMMILGEDFYNNNFERIYAAQTDGGTLALHIAGENIHKHLDKKIYFSNPTWSKPSLIFERTGLDLFFLPYYDLKKRRVDFEGYYLSLEKIPDRSVVVMHPVCHNPTGADLLIEEWIKLCDLFKKKSMIPFFDFAYQGFGSSLEEDAFPIRIFAEVCQQLFIAYTCTKNFALKEKSTGALFYLGSFAKEEGNIGEDIRRDARKNYSNFPTLGRKVVSRLLTDPFLKEQWLSDLYIARQRITKIRCYLARVLSAKRGDDYSYLEGQKGLFSLLDLTDEQKLILEVDYGIYLAEKGRINLSGINEANIEYFTSSCLEVL
jgi:aspartate aminotransferase